jgi:hypothetical protein
MKAEFLVQVQQELRKRERLAALLAGELGFDVVGVVQRALDRNKRMMPARFGKKTDSMIEQRMHEEYVIGLLKVSECSMITWLICSV